MANYSISTARALCIGFLLLAGMAHFYTYHFFQPDDTFIFLVYARNFIEGNGLTFNGELVEGFSSLCWTLIVSLTGLLCDDLLAVAKGAAALAYVGHAVLLTALLKRWHHNVSLLDTCIVMALFFALPPLAIWAASGMETILFSLLLTAAVFVYLSESCSETATARGVLPGLLFGSLAATRPEGIALIAIPCCYEFVRFLQLRTCNRKTLSTTLLVFCCLTLVLLTWRMAWFGEWLPTTVHAKTGNLQLQLVNGIHYARDFCAEYFYLIAAYVAACAYLLSRPDSRARDFTLMSAITMCGYLTFVIAAGGDWMLSYRLLAPLMPVAVLTVALALSFCKTAPLKIFLVVPVLTLAIADSYALYAPAKLQAESDQGDVIMGQYIRSLNLPAETKIAVIDAGAIPYLCGLPTIDMIGLNNTHIAKLPGGFFQKFDNAYVLAQQPGIIQMHTQQRPSGDYVPAPVFIGTMQLFYSDEFQKNYQLDARSPIKHLFTRRETPAALSMMDSFRDFEAGMHWDKPQGIASIRITKTGDGIWVSAPAQQLGSVHIGYRVEDKDGAVVLEDTIALGTDIKRNDVIELPLPAHQLTAATKITVDPVLIGVERFSDHSKSVSIDVQR